MRTVQTYFTQNDRGVDQAIIMLDRIDASDVYVNMVKAQINNLITGENKHPEVPRSVKDFLVKTRLEIK